MDNEEKLVKDIFKVNNGKDLINLLQKHKIGKMKFAGGIKRWQRDNETILESHIYIYL